MILYGLIILICMIIIAVLNGIFAAPVFGFSWLYACLATVINTAAVIAIDAIFVLIIRKLLPEKLFSYKKKFFTVSVKEKRFYEKIGIKRWKCKVPEIGCFTDLKKSKIEKPRDNEYISRYLLEACYGVVIHIVDVFAGFLIIFICPLRYWLCFGLPIALINTVLNVPSIFVLRYNTYRMKILYGLNERRTAENEK